jgi:citronellol/citronellal dehydrogenase
MSSSLRGRTAFVTGASRGIGAALAKALAHAGAVVVGVARSTAAEPSATLGTLDDTVEQIGRIGGTAHTIQADLSNEDEVRDAVKKALELTGRLDLLVNNAAAAVPADWSANRKRFDLLMNVNVWAPMLAMQEAMEALTASGDGRVLNISSIAATHAVAPLQLYGMSKAALEHLTVGAAVSLQGSRVAVNCLRVDIPVASEGALHWERFGDGHGWLDTARAAQAALAVLQMPATVTGRVFELSDLAAIDDDLRREGRRVARLDSTAVFGGIDQAGPF